MYLFFNYMKTVPQFLMVIKKWLTCSVEKMRRMVHNKK
ncbi:hypothetical protein ELI_2630 [Eubacterium callanderi]|uniref:Uncharacterized protein n=1 Tax=Eubacterium callanderi TaxID=53442 RepID=E3GNB6_9FIRM|nr:hypothetical protein ELI_2630 [Eubacterium callanderi]